MRPCTLCAKPRVWASWCFDFVLELHFIVAISLRSVDAEGGSVIPLTWAIPLPTPALGSGLPAQSPMTHHCKFCLRCSLRLGYLPSLCSKACGVLAEPSLVNLYTPSLEERVRNWKRLSSSLVCVLADPLLMGPLHRHLVFG